MFYYNLKSSSKGNCSFFDLGGTYILIDIGVNYKYLNEAMKKVNINIKQIQFIFITHCHKDHIAGLKAFVAINSNIIIYCSKYTSLKILLEDYYLLSKIRILNDEQDYKISNIKIMTIPVPHDDCHNVSYIIEKNDYKIAYITDLGMVPDELMKESLNCRTLIIESNYDVAMLKNSKYPDFLKIRISSLKGHLSNEQTTEVVKKIIENKTLDNIILTHLSKSNNTYEKAYKAISNIIDKNNTKLYVNHDDYKKNEIIYLKKDKKWSFS